MPRHAPAERFAVPTPFALAMPALFACFAWLHAVAAHAQGTGPEAVFDSAYQAWDAGDYSVALARLDRLLAMPGTEHLLDDVAVLTGERYRTLDVATDGTAPRWSPDGRHIAWEVPGAGAPDDAPRRTVVARVAEGGIETVATLEGRGAVFSPDGRRIAWLSIPDPAALAREIARITDEIEVTDRASFIRRRDAQADARARHTRVRVRDLATGREQDVRASEPVRAVVWSGGEAVPWLEGEDARMSPTGSHMVFDADEGLGLVDLAANHQRTFPGATAPSFAADGSALVYAAREGDAWTIRRVDLTEAAGPNAFPTPVVRDDTAALANPALSRDGRWVAYQRMGRENWEVWMAPAVPGAGEEPRRLTTDVQHDLFPQFLAHDRLLVIKGEGRHRRSYVYPTTTPDAIPAEPAAPPSAAPAIREWVPGSGEGMRLFHNNTVRTVAPEYEWAVSPDGTRLLVVAERDGDTITPDRGVYLVDLGAAVTRDEIRARVRAQLAAENALREKARALFAEIVAEVRAAVADVSVSRIHRYAADLHRFGTKYIGTPGNERAIEYLVETLRGFGYEPELMWFEPRPGIRSANVIARLRGTERPDATYVVGSHFDSSARGPGADDNSSGSTALLEAARVLAARPQPATIEFVWFTGEEAGLLGSREYARQARASGKQVAGALNNDMVGYANDDRLDDTIRYSSADVRDVQHAAALLFTDLILYDAHYYKSTDAHALYDAFGDVIGGIGSYPILANPHYHQSHDVLETINQRLVAEVAKATVATVMRMAGSDG